MRSIYFSFITLLGLPAPNVLFAQHNGITYLSPIPNSQYLSTSTNIIVKYTAACFPNNGLSCVSVVGSISDSLAFEIIYLKKSNTVLIEPTNDFAKGEKVNIELGADFCGNANSFSFQISSATPPPDSTEYISTKSVLENLTVDITIYDTTKLAEGSIFLTTQGGGRTNHLILDNLGNAIYQEPVDYPPYDFKKQPDGNISYYNNKAKAFFIIDTNYVVIDTFTCGNGYATNIHDLQILDNGNALIICNDKQYINMDSLVEGGNPAAVVSGVIIQEIDGNTKSVMFQWRSWDHYQITDAVHGADFTSAIFTYVHCNSIELDDDDNIIISAKKNGRNN